MAQSEPRSNGRIPMRLIACIVAAAVVMAAPAQAAWKAFKYPELGFGVDFPGEPKMSKGEYRGVIAGRVPTTIISAEADDTTYQVIIADFSSRPLDTPNILMEAAFLATQDGKVLSDTIARTDNGQKFAKYGRRVSVMTKEGAKKISEVYLVNGNARFVHRTRLHDVGEVRTAGDGRRPGAGAAGHLRGDRQVSRSHGPNRSYRS